MPSNSPRTTQDAGRKGPRFAIGDPVMRPVDVYAKHSEMRYGVVIDRYSRSTQYGHYPELYRVRWEGDVEETGFLPHGLFPADARPPR